MKSRHIVALACAALLVVSVWVLVSGRARQESIQEKLSAVDSRIAKLLEDGEQRRRQLSGFEESLRNSGEVSAVAAVAVPSTDVAEKKTSSSPEEQEQAPAVRENAVLPPPTFPFLDYDSLPEEFSKAVGENELFMMLDDGRLARLAAPHAKFSLRRDLSTRQTGEKLLQQHVTKKLLVDQVVQDRLDRGVYDRFDTSEDADTYIKERVKADGSRKLVVNKLPEGQVGYAVLDLTDLYTSAPYRAGLEAIRDFHKELGLRTTQLYLIDPPPK